MRLIDWLNFKPLEEDIDALAHPVGQSVYVRLLLRLMVRRCLNDYPWDGRADIAQLFDPSAIYNEGQAIALPVIDKQGIRPDSWRIGRVKSVQMGENPVQGKFQVVQLLADGKEYWMAAAVENAQPLSFRFPPDDDEMDFLAEDFVNYYQPQLSKVLEKLIIDGRLEATLQGDQVLFGKVVEIKADFAPWFAKADSTQPFFAVDDIILNLWDAGELKDTPEDLARVLVEKRLQEQNYVDAGDGRWMTPARLAEFDREISRRLEVPRNRSKIKAQIANMEEELIADDYLAIPESAAEVLRELEVESEAQPESTVSAKEWSPPSSPLKMPALSYLNIMRGYFTLNDTLLRGFPPNESIGFVIVQLAEGEDIHFVVNLEERALKSIDPKAVYQRFVSDLGIPAGTFLWLEYHGKNRYRIIPHPLATPKLVRCKQAWMEDGALRLEEVEIEMRYEGDEHLFRAGLRFEDMEALFREAEERDESIFDAIYDVLPKLAALRPDGLVHYKDIFNAVFFEYRMCSYHTVVHELYDHACFAEAGNGYFRFAPELGIKRRKPTRREIEKAFWKQQLPAVQTEKTALAPVEKEFWRQIASEIPRKLKTLDEERPFEITSVTHETIELIVSTGQPRTLPRFEVEQAWNLLSEQGKINRDQITKFANFNVAYVMAILTQLPDVEYRLRPLRLIYKLSSQVLVSPPNDENKNIISAEHIAADETQTEKLAAEAEDLPPVEKTRSGQFVAPALLPTEPLFSALNTSASETSEANPLTPQIEENTQAEQATPLVEQIEVATDENEGISDEILQPFDVKALARRRMFTLRFVLPFSIVHVDKGLITLNTPESNTNSGIRQISFKTIQKAWEQLEKEGYFNFVESSQGIQDRSAYVAAILSTHSRVTVNKNESMLVYHPPTESAQPTIDPAPVKSIEQTPAAQDTIKVSNPVPTQPRKIRASIVQGDEMQNKTLFSNNFMNTRLSDLPEWNEDSRDVIGQMRALWQKATHYGETWNEAQTEDEFIKPILALLDWSYVVQAKAGRGGQVTRPDYALFADDPSKDAAYPHQGDDGAFYSRTLAIAEAKYWGRALSQKDSSGRATWKAESNPSHQMVSYLNGTRATWGILTNGRIWRLYSREVSSTASEFYEVDLGNLFDFLPEGVDASAAQIDDFKRWWLFFRKIAFTTQMGGKSFVQRVHEGSALYAREISDKLKELVFEEVMPEIAGGFVSYRARELNMTDETSESLSEVYRASLSLLYKLLFLLYAEARGLLPMENPDYRVNSLTSIAEWAAEQTDQKRNISDVTFATPYYEKLLALFRRVDQGDKDLGIPHYNGGLFSPNSAENQFLTRHKLSDRAVARAVDVLVRDKGQPVDYAFISVRNLGAIYEGLLENKLKVINAAEGKVELINDKGERKASGSYYTPDYIVEYIVRNTLDPILDARVADFDTAMLKIADLRGKLLNVKDHATATRLRAEMEEAEHAGRESFLGIKVLDPAMGSGHFLVNAVDHLTDGMIERMQTWHDLHPKVKWEWNPIQQLIERVRTEIKAEMQTQGLGIDTRRLDDDTPLLTRLVMKRCIYGVDLNPMAVELARVSLWLHTFTVGAPLSFLDHHLRWGNSLMGIWDIGKYIAVGTERWNDISRTLSAMLQISEMTDSTIGEVAKSSNLYKESRTWIQPTIERLNVELAPYFVDWDKNPKTLPQVAQLAYQSEEMRRAVPGLFDKYQQSQQLALEKGFFHWKLEFPEVFVDSRKSDWARNGGFDAVIGNPPYIRPHHLDETTKKVLWNLFSDTYQAKSDILNCFVQQGLDVLSNGSSLGMITADSWMLLSSAKGLREYILGHANVVGLGMLPSKVFEDASVSTGIVLLQKEQDSKLRLSNTLKIVDVESDILSAQYPQSAYLQTEEKTFFAIAQPLYDLRKKMEDVSVTLDKVTDVNFGLKTGDDEKFIRYQRITPEDKPLISSKSIDRFSIKWDGAYVWYVPEVMTENRNTARPGDAQRFEVDKVIVNRMSERLSCTYDTERYYVKDALLMHATSKYSLGYLSCLLNSRLLDKYYSSVFTTLDLHRNELLRLPIRIIEFSTPDQIRLVEVSRAKAMYEAGQTENVFTLANKYISNQVDVIHDLLDYLARQMIKINKTRQAESEGFLGWLSRETGADLDDLTGKTTIFNYLGDYQKSEEPASQQAILEVLRKNQRKLSTDVSARKFQERLAKEYESSLDKLLPIKAKLASTDQLIDRIVYALYGLSEEEINIVEGRG